MRSSDVVVKGYPMELIGKGLSRRQFLKVSMGTVVYAQIGERAFSLTLLRAVTLE